VLFTVGGASGTNPDDKGTIGQYHQLLNTHATTNILASNAALPALLAARRDFGIATLDDGRVYVIGGRSGAGDGSLIGAANAVVEFDPKTNTVRARSSTGFTLRHSLGAVAITTSRGTRIYAVGGYAAAAAATAPTTLNQEYDPATDTWRTVLPLPAATAEFGIATPGLLNKGEPTQTVHVLGGNRGSIATPNVTGALLKFDADPNGQGAWTTLGFTITARRNLGAAAVVRGAFPFHVFALGGRNAAGAAVTTVESYVGTTTNAQQTDPTSLVATPITQLPSALHSFGIGTSNNRIYVFGGVNSAGADQTAVLELNPAANPAGGTAGALGTPSGVFTTKAPLPAAARSLGVSSPRTVANFLALKSAGRDARQDAINEWVKRAVRSVVAPDLDATAVAQGRALFGQAGLTGVSGISCASCHGGPKWTRSRVDFAAPPSPDLARGNEEVLGAELRKTLSQPGTAAGGANGVLVDVGTFVAARLNEVRPNAADASQRIAALGGNGFQAPSLLSVGATAPYLHHGIAKTLEQILDGSFDGAGASPLRNVHEVAGANDRAALVTFLKSIDAKTAIFP
jgi:mono/diheme cytochrome c family protein